MPARRRSPTPAPLLPRALLPVGSAPAPVAGGSFRRTRAFFIHSASEDACAGGSVRASDELELPITTIQANEGRAKAFLGAPSGATHPGALPDLRGTHYPWTGPGPPAD